MKTALRDFHAVRFDASYYYDTEKKVEDLCEELAERWSSHNIHVVYFRAYDPIYGAFYKTQYEHNIEGSYGTMDLLGHMIDACHKRDIKVIAWFDEFRHKEVWDTHPEWRTKGADGSDYKPTPESYPLCIRNPEFRKWWLGFLEDCVTMYPDLDGVDIAEPVVSWGRGKACYCDTCTSGFVQDHPSEKLTGEHWDIYRSQALTSFLDELCRFVREKNMISSITTIITAKSDGTLLTSDEQRSVTGFDLHAILENENRPDILNIEFLWQEWRAVHKDDRTFTPSWLQYATAAASQQVNGRATLVIHVELTDFDNQRVTSQQFAESIRAAIAGKAEGIDFYSAHLADTKDAWDEIGQAFDYVHMKKVLIVFDPEGENDARQLATLLGHFHVQHKLILTEEYQKDDIDSVDVLFYVGYEFDRSLSSAFLKDIYETERTVCWLNYNIWQLAQSHGTNKYGFVHIDVDDVSNFKTVIYKGKELAKGEPVINRIEITNPVICQAYAIASSENLHVPYIVRGRNLWYVTDIPSAYAVEGGRYVAFCDLLHDILGEYHAENHRALIRIEDINPMSNAESLRAIADYLHSQRIPFLVSLIPFYLDPSTNTTMSMSDRPDFVKAIQHMVSRGGTIVLHGCTHQFRDLTADDYEFWNAITQKPLFHDSESYVRNRIERALQECFDNGIHPLLWETPHYAASALDYSVIATYFSGSVERKQTVDVLGTDQFVPYLITSDLFGQTIIPENLGYVPYSNQSANQVVASAEKSFVVRDGFASAFFHPFININVLKELVKGVQNLGYTYVDVKNYPLRVVTPEAVVISGSGKVSMDVHDQFFLEYYVDQKGEVRQHSCSPQKVTMRIEKEIRCPPGWLYVARSLATKPKSSKWKEFSVLTQSIKSLLSNVTAAHSLEGKTVKAAKPIIIWDREAKEAELNNQMSILSALNSVGIDLKKINTDEFLDIPRFVNLLIVPHSSAAKLNHQQILFVLKALGEGVNLITEGRSGLSESIGIEYDSTWIHIEQIKDLSYPQVEMRWKGPATMQTFRHPSEAELFYVDRETDTPVVIGGDYGQGKYLYFGTSFDPMTEMGYSRFPYFIDVLHSFFGLAPIVKSNNFDFYFDPGYREEISIEKLVKLWRETGVRAIHAASWHFYPEWTYDYDRLIELAHQNGILVYAWLELPHVNPRFWEEHPEWREKTATGEDAIVFWRSLMALTDEDCRKSVLDELAMLLTNYDWDGINLAELCFESNFENIEGTAIPEDPSRFTPMHPSVRDDFQDRFGFDPLSLFDPRSPYYWGKNPEAWRQFEEYRVDEVVKLHEYLLSFLYELKEKNERDWEIIVTLFDSIHAKNFRKATGTDSPRIIELREKYPYTLQIQDPFQLWSLGPERYTLIGETYSQLIDNPHLMIDINVVPFRNPQQIMASTLQPTGTELFQLIRNICNTTHRVILYSESSVYEVDLPLLSYALGVETKETIDPDRYEIETPHTIIVEFDKKKHKNMRADGKLWPCYYNGIALIPPGSHTIEPVSKLSNILHYFKSHTRIFSLTGELKKAKSINRGLEMEYFAATRNIVLVNDRPHRIFVDDRDYDTAVLKGETGYAITLPSGDHEVRIITESKSTHVLKMTSVLLSVILVGVSLIAISFLIILFLMNLRRKRS